VCVLSDVVGNDLSTIGSGPAAVDPTTFADALEVLKRRGVLDAYPAVRAQLERGDAERSPETAKAGDEACEHAQHFVVGRNDVAVDAAAMAAEGLGIKVVERRVGVQGEAREVGRELAARVLEMRKMHPGPVAVVWGGETTVTVRGSGTGGRNQELALAA